MSAGLEIMIAVNKDMIEIMISEELSIPSPITARLPAIKPIIIFKNARKAFPIILIHEAFFILIILAFSKLTFLFNIYYNIYKNLTSFFILQSNIMNIFFN